MKHPTFQTTSPARRFQAICRARLQRTVSPRLVFSDRNESSRARRYATQSSLSGASASSPKRKAITVTSDDGRYRWTDLTPREKAARSAQQSWNFTLVLAGAVGTMAVSYFLYQELFAPDSKTRQFNHAVDRIRADPDCVELLGPGNEIQAYGEPTTNKWARARPLAQTGSIDKAGVTHFKMHFHARGPKNAGVVHVHMTKPPGSNEALSYRLLSLTVPGHPTVYLENANEKSVKAAATKMFGVQWR